MWIKKELHELGIFLPSSTNSVNIQTAMSCVCHCIIRPDGGILAAIINNDNLVSKVWTQTITSQLQVAADEAKTRIALVFLS